MMKKNKVTIAVFTVLAAILLSGCTGISDTKEPETQEISHEPIKYEGDFAEDDEMMDEESTEEVLDDHEEEAVLDESEEKEVTEEYSEEEKVKEEE